MQPQLRMKQGAALTGCIALLVAAGGIANADTTRIPTKGDKIKLCYNENAAENANGGAVLRIFDPQKNNKKCAKGDDKLTLETEADDGEDGRDAADGKDAPGGADLRSGQAIITNQAPAAPTATFTDLAGLSLVLPGPGRYLVNASLNGAIQGDGTGACVISAQLATDGAAVPGSHREVVSLIEGTGLVLDSGTISHLVDTDGPTTLTLQAADTTGSFLAGTTCADTVPLAIVGGSSDSSANTLNFTLIDEG